jgi:hypothetical protein
MPTEIRLTPQFEREARRALRKFVSLRRELDDLMAALVLNPRLGTPLGNRCFKIRLAVRSKGQGKRGEMRVITYVLLQLDVADDDIVYLASIYDKSDRDTVSDAELKALIASITTKR